MADIPDELVAWRVEHMMQRNGQLDDAEPGTDVTSGSRAVVDQEYAYFVGEQL